MHISSDKVFEDSEETIHSAEINDTSYESQADSHLEETKNKVEKPKTKEMSVLKSTNILFS